MKLKNLHEAIGQLIDHNTVYYHGTTAQFDKFDSNKSRHNGGIFFTSDPTIADDYTINHEDQNQAGKVIKANLIAKNPAAWGQTVGKRWMQRAVQIASSLNLPLERSAIPAKSTINNFLISLSPKQREQIIKAMGYDALLDGSHSVIVYDPSIIRIIDN